MFRDFPVFFVADFYFQRIQSIWFQSFEIGWGLFYGPGCGLSCYMLRGPSKGLWILLLLGRVFYKFQLDPVIDGVVNLFSILVIFVSFHCWERGVGISIFVIWLFLLSVPSCFCFTFIALLFVACALGIAVCVSMNWAFGHYGMECPSLPLVIFFSLKSALPGINITTPVFL